MIMSMTGRRRMYETPRSPCGDVLDVVQELHRLGIVEVQLLARTTASTSGVARGPAIWRAGSPGTENCSTNVSRTTPAIVIAPSSEPERSDIEPRPPLRVGAAARERLADQHEREHRDDDADERDEQQVRRVVDGVPARRRACCPTPAVGGWMPAPR